ncbi:MAG: hypothetical protein ACLQJR_20435 [Stellaceae bacterium]
MTWAGDVECEIASNCDPARERTHLIDYSCESISSGQNGCRGGWIKLKGRRYLIIPMRHNTSGNDALASAMPENI